MLQSGVTAFSRGRAGYSRPDFTQQAIVAAVTGGQPSNYSGYHDHQTYSNRGHARDPADHRGRNRRNRWENRGYDGYHTPINNHGANEGFNSSTTDPQ